MVATGGRARDLERRREPDEGGAAVGLEVAGAELAVAVAPPGVDLSVGAEGDCGGRRGLGRVLSPLGAGGARLPAGGRV